MNWDDLRIVASVGKTESFSRAARVLGIDETTVSRRLARLESTFGMPLFEAANGKRNPTAACRAILRQLDDIAHAVDDIERLLHEHDHALRKLRLTTIAVIAEHFMAPGLPHLLDELPELALSIDTSDHNADMSRWEADFAIRLGRPSQGAFLMRRIGEMRLCMVTGRLGGAAPVLAAYPPILHETPEMRHLARTHDLGGARVETANHNVLRAVMESGRASGILPACLAETLDPAAPVEITPLPEGREVWLLTQPHLRNDGLARQIADWCASLFAE